MKCLVNDFRVHPRHYRVQCLFVFLLYTSLTPHSCSVDVALILEVMQWLTNNLRITMTTFYTALHNAFTACTIWHTKAQLSYSKLFRITWIFSEVNSRPRKLATVGTRTMVHDKTMTKTTSPWAVKLSWQWRYQLSTGYTISLASCAKIYVVW